MLLLHSFSCIMSAGQAFHPRAIGSAFMSQSSQQIRCSTPTSLSLNMSTLRRPSFGRFRTRSLLPLRFTWKGCTQRPGTLLMDCDSVTIILLVQSPQLYFKQWRCSFDICAVNEARSCNHQLQHNHYPSLHPGYVWSSYYHIHPVNQWPHSCRIYITMAAAD